MTWSCVFGAHPDGCHCTNYFPQKGDRVSEEKSVNCNTMAPMPKSTRPQDDPQVFEKFKAEHCQGKRIGFTVTVDAVDSKGQPYESRYDADRLESVFRDGDMEPMLSFVSSGRRVLVEAAKVKAVEFSKPTPWYYDGQKMWHGTGHCATCDGPLSHMVKRPS